MSVGVVLLVGVVLIVLLVGVVLAVLDKAPALLAIYHLYNK